MSGRRPCTHSREQQHGGDITAACEPLLPSLRGCDGRWRAPRPSPATPWTRPETKVMRDPKRRPESKAPAWHRRPSTYSCRGGLSRRSARWRPHRPPTAPRPAQPTRRQQMANMRLRRARPVPRCHHKHCRRSRPATPPRILERPAHLRGPPRYGAGSRAQARQRRPRPRARAAAPLRLC